MNCPSCGHPIEEHLKAKGSSDGDCWHDWANLNSPMCKCENTPEMIMEANNANQQSNPTVE